MSNLPELSLFEWAELRDLQRLLDKPSRTNRDMARRLRMLANSLDHCAELKDAYQNPSGTLDSASSPTAPMETSLRKSGLVDMKRIHRPKPTNDLHAHGASRARPRARNSTPSTPPRAKRARTGGRSKARSALVERGTGKRFKNLDKPRSFKASSALNKKEFMKL
jgi:hypothetical protein